MRRGQDSVEQPYFSGHKSLWAFAKADKQAFSRPQFRDAIAAQRFHMDKYIFGTFALAQKSKTARAVEPFDDGDLKAAGEHNFGTGAGRAPFGRMHGFRSIKGDNFKNL